MHKNCFVGAGLSASFAQLLYWRDGDFCLYPSTNLSPFAIRRPQLEINKLLSTRAKSFGSNEYQLACATLHDRTTIGGNSEIWGGFFDTAQVNHLDKLTEAGIHLIPLSFGETGSVSNISTLVQLQEKNGEIFNASNHIRPGSNKYLYSLHCQSGQITLKCVSTEKPDASEITVAGKVFICTGVVQTIDVLMRSKLINPGDELTLDEFEYELAIGGEKLLLNERDASVITYTPGRAAAHLLGFQKASIASSINPFAVHQVFHARTKTLRMVAGDHVLIGGPVVAADRKPTTFGKSIHYCNLKINGESLVDIAARLSPNLHFVSMASVFQAKPGPISSDIFSYLERISNEL